MSALAHLAGSRLECGGRVRQRCEWCGAVLIDVDRTRIAAVVPDGAGPGWQPEVPTWPAGRWVEVDGSMSVLLAEDNTGRSPENSCMRLDPEVTG